MTDTHKHPFGTTRRRIAAVGQGSWKIEEASDAESARIDAVFPRGKPPRGLPMI